MPKVNWPKRIDAYNCGESVPCDLRCMSVEYTNHDIKECILEATLEDIEAIFWPNRRF